MLTQTEAAYFAGIIDGEGHVAVRGGSGSGNQGLVLCMADIPILEWCAEHVGGTLSGSWRAERGNSRPRRIWKMTDAASLLETLPAVIPYLVLKRDEALVLQRAAGLTIEARRRSGFADRREALLQEVLTIRARRKQHPS